ncbi:MAG: hypothetical protein ABI910_03140 [Gemmatimonadota bacterium]
MATPARTASARNVVMAALALASTACRPSAPYAQVDIVAHNYSFTVPATLPPGPTAFRFINAGSVLHEAQLFRFASGISADSARRMLASGIIPDSAAEVQGGILVGVAGDTVRQRILDDLRSGAVYGINCEFRDSTGAPQHSRLGMYAVIRVQ